MKMLKGTKVIKVPDAKISRKKKRNQSSRASFIKLARSAVCMIVSTYTHHIKIWGKLTTGALIIVKWFPAVSIHCTFPSPTNFVHPLGPRSLLW